MDMVPLADVDPEDTNAWIESLDSVLRSDGQVRARYLLSRLLEHAAQSGVALPF